MIGDTHTYEYEHSFIITNNLHIVSFFICEYCRCLYIPASAVIIWFCVFITIHIVVTSKFGKDSSCPQIFVWV